MEPEKEEPGAYAPRNTCPLLSVATDMYHGCLERKCAWWTEARTTENIVREGCALVLLVGMNSNGLFRV